MNTKSTILRRMTPQRHRAIQRRLRIIGQMHLLKLWFGCDDERPTRVMLRRQIKAAGKIGDIYYQIFWSLQAQLDELERGK